VNTIPKEGVITNKRNKRLWNREAQFQFHITTYSLQRAILSNWVFDCLINIIIWCLSPA
jgi:hypothetical protein